MLVITYNSRMFAMTNRNRRSAKTYSSGMLPMKSSSRILAMTHSSRIKEQKEIKEQNIGYDKKQRMLAVTNSNRTSAVTYV
jgi:hypothetical protein